MVILGEKTNEVVRETCSESSEARMTERRECYEREKREDKHRVKVVFRTNKRDSTCVKERPSELPHI